MQPIKMRTFCALIWYITLGYLKTNKVIFIHFEVEIAAAIDGWIMFAHWNKCLGRSLGGYIYVFHFTMPKNPKKMGLNGMHRYEGYNTLLFLRSM